MLEIQLRLRGKSPLKQLVISTKEEEEEEGHMGAAQYGDGS